MKLIATLLTAFLPTLLLAQNVVINSSRTLGGTSWDLARSVCLTSDGGYVLACHTESNDGQVTGNHGLSDGWIVKFSAGGTIEWQTCIGGDQNDWANDIVQTPDSGYLVVGTTYSEFPGDEVDKHAGTDVWIVKLDASGTQLWQKCFGGDAADAGSAIVKTVDGGYLIAANTFSNDGHVSGNHGQQDGWIIKLNHVYAREWQTCVGGSLNDLINSIAVLPDGGYMLGGGTFSNDGDVSGNHGKSDAWIVKVSAAGAVESQRCIGGTDDDFSVSLRRTSDNGFIFTAFTESRDGELQGNTDSSRALWVVKLDSGGSTIAWQRYLGGMFADEGFSVKECTGGGYIVAGLTQSNNGDVSGNHGGADGWLVKLSPTGSLEWQKCIGGKDAEYIHQVVEVDANEFIGIGYTFSSDGDISSNNGGPDAWIVRLFTTPSAVQTLSPYYVPLSVYPNPASSTLTVQLPFVLDQAVITMTDLHGAIVRTVMPHTGLATTIDVTDLSAGSYFLAVRAGTFTETIMIQIIR
jgi:hypothetical protein